MLLERPSQRGMISIRIVILVHIPLDAIVVRLGIDGIERTELFRIYGSQLIDASLQVGPSVNINVSLQHYGSDVDDIVHGTGGHRLRLQAIPSLEVSVTLVGVNLVVAVCRQILYKKLRTGWNETTIGNGGIRRSTIAAVTILVSLVKLADEQIHVIFRQAKRGEITLVDVIGYRSRLVDPRNESARIRSILGGKESVHPVIVEYIRKDGLAVAGSTFLRRKGDDDVRIGTIFDLHGLLRIEICIVRIERLVRILVADAVKNGILQLPRRKQRHLNIRVVILVLATDFREDILAGKIVILTHVAIVFPPAPPRSVDSFIGELQIGEHLPVEESIVHVILVHESVDAPGAIPHMKPVADIGSSPVIIL